MGVGVIVQCQLMNKVLLNDTKNLGTSCQKIRKKCFKLYKCIPGSLIPPALLKLKLVRKDIKQSRSITESVLSDPKRATPVYLLSNLEMQVVMAAADHAPFQFASLQELTKASII